jgi:uncharacterized protein
MTLHAPKPRRRNIRFSFDAPIPRFWLDGDCHRTRFYDAMSITFPEGERAFIETVQLHRKSLRGNDALERDAAEFIAQEALHTREHVRYNERLRKQGLPVDELESRVARQQTLARRVLSPATRLAFTVCLEHFTAMFGDRLLRDGRTFASADPRMSALWQWHAMEEIEHKGVAFDIYTVAVKGSLRRYVLRCLAMLIVTPVFSTLLWGITFSMIRRDGQALNMKGWLRLFWEHFICPGSLTRMAPSWVQWFSPSFHPWRDDNSELIKRFSAQFDARAHHSGDRRLE